MLTVFVDGKATNDKFYFYDVNRCHYFRQSIAKQNRSMPRDYSYRSPQMGATCQPIYVREDSVLIWK